MPSLHPFKQRQKATVGHATCLIAQSQVSTYSFDLSCTIAKQSLSQTVNTQEAHENREFCLDLQNALLQSRLMQMK